MPRIRPVEYAETTPAVRAAHDEVIREHGRITNMKRTLLHSLPAFQALMEWYPLRDTVQPFLGERSWLHSDFLMTRSNAQRGPR